MERDEWTRQRQLGAIYAQLTRRSVRTLLRVRGSTVGDSPAAGGPFSRRQRGARVLQARARAGRTSTYARCVRRSANEGLVGPRVDRRSLRAQGIDRVPQFTSDPKCSGWKREASVPVAATRRSTSNGGTTSSHYDAPSECVSIGPRRRSDRNAIERIHTVGEGRVLASDGPNASSAPSNKTAATNPESKHLHRANADRERSLRQATRAHVDAARNAPEHARSADSGVSGQAKLEPPGTEPAIAEAADRDLPKSPGVPFGGSQSRETTDGPVVDGEPAVRHIRDVDREASPDDEVGGEHEGRGTSPSSRTAGSGAPIDRTARAVERQLRAMGGGRFEIGIREATTGQWMTRSGSAAELLERLPWLKRMNVQGNDIFVRPARERSAHALVLVGDLDRATLTALERDGRAPAAIVESAPGRYEVWIRVGREAPAEEYGIEPSSASAHRYGRLSGFTNQSHHDRTVEAPPPFALLRGASGRVAPDGRALLREATLAIGRPDPSVEQGRGRDDVAPPRRRGGSVEEARSSSTARSTGSWRAGPRT